MNCEYCNYDKDDFIKPFDKQGHVYISGSMKKTCVFHGTDTEKIYV